MKHRVFDVVVVGGGHAGAEAAAAAARAGARVALVTHRLDRIGEMSCNPAIGGLGKGHIVREIDALDGVMGRAADRAGIQFRLLNRSKGPAVRGPRVQADRALYRQAVQEALAGQPRLTLIGDEVIDILHEGDRFTGLALAHGGELFAAAVVLTTGTFLRGEIHIGEERRPAGRVGDPAAIRLAARIDELGFPLGRLKTGTPPRLSRASIAWDSLPQQPGDETPELLSFLSTGTHAPQVCCAVTETNSLTHDIIRQNLQRSAVYGGRIAGPGPRYCPSIEDKVVRFAERDTHTVFLEPEGVDSPLVYPNGLSTSLPPDVQEVYVRSIQGLENAIIIQPGYAIEYDYVDPRALRPTLETKALGGLFLAGQINGTTGYEEAAGQGVIAGVNAAALALGRDPVVLDRAQAYIGVMIDDLVTRGVTEPYRMFTSRAEFRLQLRADNADQRLSPLGIALGIVGDPRRRAFSEKMEALSALRDSLAEVRFSPVEARALGFEAAQDGVRRSALDLLSHGEPSEETLRSLSPVCASAPAALLEQVCIEARYAPYLARQAADVAMLRRDEAVNIPESLDFRSLSGLSGELREKLERIRPRTLGQAARIEGMTPAALTLLLLRARQALAARAAS